MNTSVATRWVIARYIPSSPQGKTALALSGEGIGYVLMNPERHRSDDVIVAFRRPDVEALPPHLAHATDQQSEMLDRKRGH